MSGQQKRKVQAAKVFMKTAAGSYTITAPAYPSSCEVWLWGAGAGSGSGGGADSGGGGGAALYKRLVCGPGQSLNAIVGAGGVNPGGGTPGTDGADSTLTLPTGQVLIAGGGKASASTTGGASGVATGGDLNRTGGQGGNAGGAPSVGQTGTFGAPGGTAGSSGGGAGSAGFTDRADDFGGGSGGNSGAATGPGVAPGGGGGGGGNNGAAGRLMVVFSRISS